LPELNADLAPSANTRAKLISLVARLNRRSRSDAPFFLPAAAILRPDQKGIIIIEKYSQPENIVPADL
jgi:hypothetical protein